MNYPSKIRTVIVLIIGVLLNIPGVGLTQEAKISFNRDVRPILASKCFACHGPDENHQEAGLRLDLRSAALDHGVLSPGDPGNSEVISRIESEEASEVMPPAETGDVLSSKEKQLLRQWIAEGANYEKHWAFVKPEKVTPPECQKSQWVNNPIDSFVLSKLENRGWSPAQRADKYALIRRVYLDLIGVPPTPEQADAFANSTDPNAYADVVASLLSSPRYGERWALPWLDLARYSDTNGYEKDRPRSIWPYRDWVIRSLNEGVPYDQFSIEQLAGDMLPDSTDRQKVATGFHRNTMLNEEGGIDPLEYRYLAMVDRVGTTGTVWMGLTTSCAQCHTHKYDPITHTEYFKLFALLNNADEPDLLLKDEKYLERQKQHQQRLTEVEDELKQKYQELAGEADSSVGSEPNTFGGAFGRWLKQARTEAKQWTVIRPSFLKSNMPKLELMKDGSIFASGDTTKRDVYELEFELDGLADEVKAIRIEALPDDRLPDRGPGKTYYEGRKGDFFLSELDASLDGLPIKFTTASHSFSEPGEKRPKFRADNVFDGDGSTGWFPGARKSRRLSLVMQLEKPIKSGGKLSLSMLFERHYTVSLGRFRVSIASEREVNADRRSELVDSLLRQERALNEEEVARLERQFLLESPVVEPVRKELEKLVASPPTAEHSLVMKERASANLRPTFRHHRGEYLSPKEPVTGGIPQVLRDGSGEPKNRLELARWLVSERNPLAARVAVNRAWREFFGEGLVKGSDDFGGQTPLPIHAELLDWLSVHYQGDLGWSTKELHRMIVMSATYQQSSSNRASRKLDPDNAYLSRGPSFRLPGEVVRDLALSATGALSTKMYGPGVRPPQPSSVTDLAWGNSRWTPSKGEDRFRRSIYTFRKRTASFAAYTVFDGPTGEVCTAMRNRSNTPLQALTLMNDDMFVELTKIHAKQVTEKFDSVSSSLEYIFRSFLTRKPTVTELSQLRTFFDAQKRRLASGELSVEEVGGRGATIDTAAYALVSRAVMNLHETITKP